MASDGGGEIFFEFGAFRLYPVRRVLTCAGKEVKKLQNQSFEILLILLRCRAREREIPSEELRQALWGGHSVPSINLFVSINQLRKTLRVADPAAAEYIITKPRKGFRFIETVSEHRVQLALAVLPFTPQGSQNASHEILEESTKPIAEIGREMADTLTTKLNKNMSIRVTPSATVSSEYNEHPKLSPLIFGHRLEVDYVFSGRIWREKDRVHVNVDLIDVRADKCTASSSFEGDYADSFELDNLIYEWMESMLGLNPTERETQQSTKQFTSSQKAYESYKRGRMQRFQVSEASLRRAINYFEQAVKEDPDFARAYASIADTYIFMGMLNLIPPQESYQGARQAAFNALAKDQTIASAHTARAFTKMFFEWHWLEAERSFARAIELNSNYPVAHMGYAQWFTAQGLSQNALTEIDQAMALDPHSFFISFVCGMILFLFRKYDQSLEQFERTHELNRRFNLKSDLPYYGRSLAYEYLALTQKVDTREEVFRSADAEARKAITLSNRHPLKLMHRIQLKAIWGKKDEALKILDQVLQIQRAGNYVSQYHLGIVYAALGETDLSIECLTKAHEEHDQWFFLLGVDPRLDTLRLDSRFEALLLGIGLKAQTQEPNYREPS